jgi:hypothetical protein
MVCRDSTKLCSCAETIKRDGARLLPAAATATTASAGTSASAHANPSRRLI